MLLIIVFNLFWAPMVTCYLSLSFILKHDTLELLSSATVDAIFPSTVLTG